METAAAAGVPIADTLRTIADPDTDDVFVTPKPDDVAVETPKPAKKKAPPKPKRTFSNCSKPEIKFVADSFVIEYYPSTPRRTQSESSAQNRSPKSQGNYVNVCISGSDGTDGKSVSSSDESQADKEKDGMQIKNDQSAKRAEGEKPTTKVVSDLDSLLLKLAAEVQKPSTKPELSSTKPELSSTKPELSSTKPELSSTKPELSSTKPELSSTNIALSSTNRDVSSTKPDDEGYCSLSRKPGARSMKMKHENELCPDDLFKKEKLVTTFEKDADGTEKSGKVEISCSYDSQGREMQEGVVEMTADHMEDQTADSGEFSERKAFDNGVVFYRI